MAKVSPFFVIVTIITFVDTSKACHRAGRSLVRGQERSTMEMVGMGMISTKETIQSFKDDFDLNVHFGLRKIGINNKGSTNASKCYGNLGCLHITDEWYGLTRPVNVLPLDRHIINTRFLLTTRESIGQPRFLNLSQPLSLSASTFDPNRPTKVIIHGFIDTGFVPWISEMTNLFLLNNDVNVIVIDWGGGSGGLYSQSAANTRLVGLEVANLIDHLIMYNGARVDDFHIIGHSLGAHIAGYAGEKLIALNRGKLGRISALDPAQPLFQDMPMFVRLDPGDAEFVDVIHTDAKSILMGGYGMESPCGHVDFYPNGGFDQPGCSLFDVPVSFDAMGSSMSNSADMVGRHLVACSHNRGIELYIDSLRATNCHMVGHKCDSYENFESGLCFDCGQSQDCVFMGERAIEYKPHVRHTQQSTKFYLKTGKKAPFCQHHYLLELNLALPSEAERWVQGFLKVNLYGTKSEITDVELAPERDLLLERGVGRNFWVHVGVAIGRIRSAETYWQFHQGYYMYPKSYCIWDCNGYGGEEKVLLVHNMTISGLELGQSLRLTHGHGKSFVLGFSRDLGTVNLVNVFWSYDHDIDPLDPLKVCVLLICSDSIYVQNLAVSSDSASGREPAVVERTVICGDSEDGYATIKSGEWKLFYKECS